MSTAIGKSSLAMLTPGRASLAGILLGTTLLVATYLMLITPMKERQAAQDKEIAKLASELSNNRALVAAAPKLKTDSQKLEQALQKLLATQLVPEDNPLRWVSTLLDELGTAIGIAATRSVTPAGSGSLDIAPTSSGRRQVKHPPCPFEEYMISLEIDATYHQLGRFIELLETRLPTCHVDSLTIRKRAGSGDELLRASLKIGFLRFSARGFPLRQRPDLPPTTTATAEGDLNG